MPGNSNLRDHRRSQEVPDLPGLLRLLLAMCTFALLCGRSRLDEKRRIPDGRWTEWGLPVRVQPRPWFRIRARAPPQGDLLEGAETGLDLRRLPRQSEDTLEFDSYDRYRWVIDKDIVPVLSLTTGLNFHWPGKSGTSTPDR